MGILLLLWVFYSLKSRGDICEEMTAIQRKNDQLSSNLCLVEPSLEVRLSQNKLVLYVNRTIAIPGDWA